MYLVKDKTELMKIIKNSSVDADLNYLDVSEIIDMSSLFYNSKFNGDISKWNVSNVLNMHSMFYGSKFNGDISEWNIINNNSDIKLKGYDRNKHIKYLKTIHPEYFFSDLSCI